MRWKAAVESLMGFDPTFPGPETRGTGRQQGNRALGREARVAAVKASVVMATYNRRALLPCVLDPLLADPAAAEVVVVVDGCDDGSIEYLRERAAAEPRLKPQLIENSGAVRAQQFGV